MKTLFIDFAETLGYRANPELDTDLLIINKYVGKTINNLAESYVTYCNTSNIYDRKLSFAKFKSEYEFTVQHFQEFLSSYYSPTSAKSISEQIATDKYNTLCHKLYPDVMPFLIKYCKLFEIIILSDGRPSRRRTLELLGLNKYCSDFYISDEIGFLKTNVKFYKNIFKKVKCQDPIYFVDDYIVNLDTLSHLKKIIGILIDRKNINISKNIKYKIVSKLSSNIFNE